MAVNGGNQIIFVETAADSVGEVLETHVKSVRPALGCEDYIFNLANDNGLKMSGRSIRSPVVDSMPWGCPVRSRYGFRLAS